MAAGTNDFLPFAVSGSANVETQAAWAAETSLLATGFQSGVANSAQFNKALRQSSIIASAVAQFIANSGPNVVDDGTTATIVSNMTSAINALVAAGGASAQGSYKNLQLSATGTSAQVSVSFDELVLGNGSGSYVVDRNISGTITTTTTGANGLDTGTLAASTWYSIWRIGKTDGTRAWLFSLSATAPTMPTGYTLKARIGWFRTDGTANKYPLSFVQNGRRVQYKVAASSNVSALPQMASGTAGAPSTPTYVSVAWSSFAPATASAIRVLLRQPAATAGVVVVAPNNAYGSYLSTSNPPPLVSSGGTYVDGTTTGDVGIESSSIYWASGGSASNGLFAAGWEDNL